MNNSYSLSSLIVFVVACAGVHCLKLIDLTVPSWVKRGEAIWLNCSLEYKEENLYSIKWYKDDTEFYRYLPKDKNKNQIYDLKGVYVDLDLSDRGYVYLNYTDFDTEGLYLCEASKDRPNFQTVDAIKHMKIYELPTNDPQIHGLLNSYDIGDLINATCEAAPSKPAANLSWYIDEELVLIDLEESYSVVKNEDGLESASLKLNYTLPEKFQDTNTINVKCVATVTLNDSFNSEEITISNKNNTVKTHSNTPQSPVLSGVQSSYQTGDSLNINCTSPKLFPVPEIQWQINGEKVPPDFVIQYPNDLGSMNVNESQTVVVGLKFTLEWKHQDAKVKCSYDVPRITDTRTDVKAIENQRLEFRLAENKGEYSVLANNSPGSSNHIMPMTEALLLLLLLPFL